MHALAERASDKPDGVPSADKVAKILQDEYASLDGAFIADFGSIFVMHFIGAALYAILFFSNIVLIPSNWETDPQGAWTYFIDTFLLPGTVAVTLFTVSTRLRETSIMVQRKTACRTITTPVTI